MASVTRDTGDGAGIVERRWRLTPAAAMVAALAAAALFAAPALADHRPGNIVVMGGTLVLTGPRAAAAKRHLNSYKLYVDELNASGGLLGHKVELKIYDDKRDSRTAVELYEKLITEDKVDIIIGPYGSKLSDTVANVMERYRRPFVAWSVVRKLWQRGRKYVFSGPYSTERRAERHKGTLHIAKKIGIKRIAIISRATPASRPRFVATNDWAKKLGLKVVLSERYRPEETDFRALLRKIEASGAEAIFSHSGYLGVVAQLRQLRELNINVKMFASAIGPSSPKFMKELGELAEYVVGRTSWLPTSALGHPGIAEFVEKYERRYGEEPNYHSANGHIIMQLMAEAVKTAGSFDPEKVREALASMAIYTIKGPYKANEQGYSRSAHVIFHINYQLQNGRRVLLWPERLAEGKFLPMPKWEDRAKK